MPLLNLPQIAESQAAAYVTSNDADAALEQALCDGKLDHDATAGDFTISDTDFRRNWFHRIGGTAVAPLDVTIPAIKRPFMVQNTCGEIITVTTGAGSSYPLLDGEVRLLYGDGISVIGLTDVAGGGGGLPAFSGAQVRLTSDFLISANTATAINWDSAEYDTDSYFGGGGTSILTVPSGVSKIILRSQIRWTANSSNEREVLFYKSGSANYQGRAYSNRDARSKLLMNISSPVLNVLPGDNFECVVYQNSAGNQFVQSDYSTWFSIQAVG